MILFISPLRSKVSNDKYLATTTSHLSVKKNSITDCHIKLYCNCNTKSNVLILFGFIVAICEKCGAIGVKHAFYTRHRKYCSLACARGILDDGNIKETADEENNLQMIENANTYNQYKVTFFFATGWPFFANKPFL